MHAQMRSMMNLRPRLGPCLRSHASAPTVSFCCKSRSRRVSVRASGEEDTSKKGNKDSAYEAKVEQLLDEMKKAGLTQAKARDLLKAWAKTGAEEPEQVRELLIKRLTKPLQVLFFQTLLDGAGAFGGFFTGGYIGDQPDFFGKSALQILATFVGFYYFLQAMIELSVLTSCLWSAYKYGSSSTEVLAAVRQMAEPSSIVEKATVAVSTVRVLQILDEIQALLKEQFGDDVQGKSNTLQNLRAYITLSQAKEKLGFKPENYGLTEKQASNIAIAFSTYDLNDNGRLETSEIGQLCARLGKSLSDAELKEAVRLLDTGNKGYIQFEEWVRWWCQSYPPGAAAAQE